MMKMPHSTFASLLRIAVMGAALSAAAMAEAAGGFLASLTENQRELAGVVTLTPEQQGRIDQYVAADVLLARQQGGPEFPADFVERRTLEERQRAGLDLLTPAQRDQLDQFVRAAVNAGPKPKERPRIRDSDVFVKAKPEVHGEVSLTYGRSSGGGDFRGASMWVDYFDPNTGVSLGIGISQFSGNGWLGFYPGYGGYGDPYGYDLGYYGLGGYRRGPYTRFDRYDRFSGGDDHILDLSADWNSSRYRGFRRR